MVQRPSALPHRSAAVSDAFEYQLGPEDKILFLHIPKTAGLTLRHVLEERFDPSTTFPPYYSRDFKGITPADCAPYRLFRGHLPYGFIRPLIGARPITITMLRDPVERFISHYCYLRSFTFDPPVAPAVLDGLTLEQYVDRPDLLERTDNVAPQCRMIAQGLDLDTLTELGRGEIYGRRADGSTTLELATRLIDQFAVVGITERFQESLFLLCYAFGWHPVENVESQNITVGRPGRHEIAPETIRRIIAVSALDAQLHDRALRLFDARYARMTRELVTRYGGGPDEIPDLTPARMRDLLDRHYRHRLVATRRPIRELHLPLDRTIDGRGWHRPESHPVHGPYRWTGPGTDAEVDLTLAADRDVCVRFKVMTALAPDVLDSVRLEANGEPLALVRHPQADWTTIFSGWIPRQTIARGNGLTRLSVRVCRTINPGDLDPASPDRRQLGLAVNWFAVTPA